jgi:hypothetical protein
MTSLENLVRLKTLALAEDAKNFGGFNDAQYVAWTAYQNAVDQCVAEALAERDAEKANALYDGASAIDADVHAKS